MDLAGIVQDRMGRTSNNGLQLILVHANTNDSPVVSGDAEGFSIA